MNADQFLENYPPAVRSLIGKARGFLIENVPGLEEELDLPSKIMIFRIAPGAQEIVFSLIPSKKGARLGFYRGRHLEDPAGLLKGEGKLHASIPLNEGHMNDLDFKHLVHQAADAARARVHG